MRFPIILAVLAVVHTALAKKRYETSSGPIPGKINVHLVPHSHDDVGWLKTVDQYFLGSNRSIQHAEVNYLLSSVMDALSRNPDRKFIENEMAFFSRWWDGIDEAERNLTRRLVESGQLSFINGGWCQHDEAAAHYVDMIDQTTLGHRFIKDTFGKVPTAGWQIDPFGHSSTQAALLSAEVGFESLWFARADYQDKEARLKDKRMQFMWRASPSLGATAEVLTGLFLVGYGPPSGFCWDVFCSDDGIYDRADLEEYNVDAQVEKFVQQCLSDQQHSATDTLMYLFGSDFQHEQSVEYFENIDKLIHYVNKDGRVNAFYSTPSLFADDLKATATRIGYSWTVKTDDFFPYLDNPHASWAGYFTSRPALKRYIRIGSGYFHAARALDVIGNGDGSTLKRLAAAMGVVQHHDSVTGTSKQHVAFDYAKRIAWGVADGTARTNAVLATLTKASPADLTQCHLRNVSQCIATSSLPAVAIVYNPVARAVVTPVRIPVPVAHVVITDAAGKTLNSSTVASPPGDVAQGGLSYTAFVEVAVPAAGFTTVFVAAPAAAQPDGVNVAIDDAPTTPVSAASVSISNDRLLLTFDSTTGLLSAMKNKATGQSIDVRQDFLWYNSSTSATHNWGSSPQNSGAYIFRPNKTDPFRVASGAVTLSVSGAGTGVQTVTQVFSDWLTQTVRLYKGQPFAEFEWTVGPVPFHDGLGKEVITRFTSSIASANYSYTDSNGREMLQRKVDFRPSWDLNVTEPVADNYFPVASAAFIKTHGSSSGGDQLTVLTDRAQGGGSLGPGMLELMVHRRLLVDDARGVGEPLNETQGITPYPNPHRLGHGLIIRGSHRVFLEPSDTAADVWRPAMDEMYYEPVVAFAKAAESAWKPDHTLDASLLGAALPSNVALLTLEATGYKTLLVRLAHQFGVGESATNSKPATVSLSTLLSPLGVASVTEVSLTANQPVDAIRNRARVATDDPTAGTVEGGGKDFSPVTAPNYDVTLGPLQIRTFTVALQ